MKKQSGPFKLKYKKSAFPFSENFHTKKHGKLKIDRSKKIDDVGSGLEKTGMIEAVKNIKTTKPKSQILDLPKTSGKRGKISSPPPKKQPVRLPEFMKKPFDSGISIFGNPKSSRSFSSRLKESESKKRASRRGAAGTGFFRP